MSQNTSYAVMAQRVEAHDSLDDFPTQPWATRALIEYVLRTYQGDRLGYSNCWEPACNRGHMARPLAEAFQAVWCSDIHDYGWDGQHAVEDFLWPTTSFGLGLGTDWVITNPPFRLAEQFIEKALQVSCRGVAVIVRTAFLEGVGRYTNLFSTKPPNVIAQFSERVPMVKGRLTETGSTATAYCWLVWLEGRRGTEFQWIPPCRKRLERTGDYRALEVVE